MEILYQKNIIIRGHDLVCVCHSVDSGVNLVRREIQITLRVQIIGDFSQWYHLNSSVLEQLI